MFYRIVLRFAMGCLGFPQFSVGFLKLFLLLFSTFPLFPLVFHSFPPLFSFFYIYSVILLLQFRIAFYGRRIGCRELELTSDMHTFIL